MERAENRVKKISKCGENAPELWDAYLADGTVTGGVLVRGEQIPEGLYHAVAEVFVLHDDGSVLLMQRDWSKPNYPGHWESGASGSVVKGESFLQGALRELWEETGIRAQELEPIYTVVRRNAIYKGYLCRTDVPKDAVTLQPGETIAYRWVQWQQFMEVYESADFVDTLRERLSGFVAGLSEGKESVQGTSAEGEAAVHDRGGTVRTAGHGRHAGEEAACGGRGFCAGGF